MKLLKIVIGTITTLILLLIVAVIVLVTLINPNDFKSKITDIVHKETGRELTIGNIGWSFFPWLGVKINDVSLSNTADFKGQDFIKIGEADIRVQLLPLFKGKIEVDTLEFKNADIHLVKNKIGKTNWQNLVVPVTKTSTTQNITATKSSTITIINITDIDISNSNIFWSDAQADQKLDLHKLNLNCKNITIDPAAKELSEQLKLQGDISVDQIIANQIQLTNVKTHVNFEKGIMVLKPLRANFYGGNIDSNITINLQSKIPTIKIEESLHNIQLESLLKDLANTNDLSGTANLDINITTIGSDTDVILKNLNGNGHFSVINGSLKGVDVEGIVSIAEALLHKLPIPKINRDSTDFNALTGSFAIHNGVVNNNDLLLKGNKFQLLGQGSINLISTDVNYQVKAAKVDGDKVHTVLVPIKITGTFSKLNYKPDFDYVLKQSLGTTVKQVTQNAIENITTGNPIGRNLGRGLDKLFH